MLSIHTNRKCIKILSSVPKSPLLDRVWPSPLPSFSHLRSFSTLLWLRIQDRGGFPESILWPLLRTFILSFAQNTVADALTYLISGSEHRDSGSGTNYTKEHGAEALLIAKDYPINRFRISVWPSESVAATLWSGSVFKIEPLQ